MERLKKETARTDSSPDRAADFRQEEYGGGDGGDVGVRDGGLGADLRGDGGEAAAHALEDLRPDDLDGGAVDAAGVDHEADAAVF